MNHSKVKIKTFKKTFKKICHRSKVSENFQTKNKGKQLIRYTLQPTLKYHTLPNILSFTSQCHWLQVGRNHINHFQDEHNSV